MKNQLAKPVVLVVDDEPLNIKIIRKIIIDFCRVCVATNGKKAIEIAESDLKPDLILLDIMMPGMNGHEVCKKLKSLTGTKDIPIIFVTAKTGIAERAEGLQLGAIDYITKPFKPEAVTEKVKTQLRAIQK
jgi:putative two-component system response regulator